MLRPILFTPGSSYPAISVTGRWCGLMCSYCRARYLRGMLDVEVLRRPGMLGEWVGVLVSGGFDRYGRLPVPGWLPGVLRELRRRGLIVSVHCLNPEGGCERLILEDAVDYVDLEVPVSRRHVELMGLGEGLPDAMEWLERMRVEYAPHLLIGLPGVDESEELAAVDRLTSYVFDVAVFIVFIPTKGTPLWCASAPGPGRVLRVLRYASDRLGAEIALGCMRPYALKRMLDPFLAAVGGLVDRLATPYRGLARVSSAYRVLQACCSIPSRFLTSVPRSRLGPRRAPSS